MGGQVSSKDILYNGHHHVVLAGENTGSGLDNSALSLLSLQQSYPFPGAGGSGGVQIALGPGQTYAGNIIILMVHVKPKLSQPLKFYQMAQWLSGTIVERSQDISKSKWDKTWSLVSNSS